MPANRWSQACIPDSGAPSRRLAARPNHPPTDRRRLAAEEHVREQKGHASGFDRSTGLDVGGERPLERIGRLIGLARPPCGLAHLLEIVGRQTTVAVGRGEGLKRLRPGVALDGVPAELDRIGRRGIHVCLVVTGQLPSDYPRRPQPA